MRRMSVRVTCFGLRLLLWFLLLLFRNVVKLDTTGWAESVSVLDIEGRLMSGAVW